MSLLTDLGRKCKTVKVLIVWLKKIENAQALDILEYEGNKNSNMNEWMSNKINKWTILQMKGILEQTDE